MDLTHLIPSPNPKQVSRRVYKLVTDLLPTGTPIILVGGAGSGKTEIPRQIAAERHLPHVRVDCNGSIEFDQVIGRWSFDRRTPIFSKSDFLKALLQPSVVSLDEVSTVDPINWTGPLNMLLDSRTVSVRQEGRTYRLHAGVLLFLAANPPSDGYQVNEVSTALMNRPYCCFVPPFSRDEIHEYLCANYPELISDVGDNLVKFYDEMQRARTEQHKHFEFSIRNISKFAEAWRIFHDVRVALRLAFLNSVLLTDDLETMDGCCGIATSVFGLDFGGCGEE